MSYRYYIMCSAAVGLFSVIAAAASAGEPMSGKACNVEHEAKTHSCRSISGNPNGPKWVIVKDGAYKTCGDSDNPKDTCKEEDKATHTIEIYNDADCTQLNQSINVSQLRCD